MWSTGRWQLFVLLSERSPSLLFHCLLCCCSAGVICILHLFPGYQLTLHSLAPAGRSPAVNADKEAQQAETMEVVFLSQTVCQFLLAMGEIKLFETSQLFLQMIQLVSTAGQNIVNAEKTSEKAAIDITS